MGCCQGRRLDDAPSLDAAGALLEPREAGEAARPRGDGGAGQGGAAPGEAAAGRAENSEKSEKESGAAAPGDAAGGRQRGAGERENERDGGRRRAAAGPEAGGEAGKTGKYEAETDCGGGGDVILAAAFPGFMAVAQPRDEPRAASPGLQAAPQAAPGELPPGWEQLWNIDGRAYYRHRASRRTQWTRPPPPRPPRGRAVWFRGRRAAEALPAAGGGVHGAKARQPLVYARPHATVEEGIRLLAARGLAALPILYDDDGEDLEEGEAAGMITLFDMLLLLLAGSGGGGGGDGNGDGGDDSDDDDDDDAVLRTPLREALNKLGAAADVQVHEADGPLLDLLQFLAAGRAHRALLRVPGAPRPGAHVVSASDALRMLTHAAQRPGGAQLREALAREASAAAAGAAPPVVLGEASPVGDAFRAMAAANARAVAVTDAAGAAVDTLASTDIRGMTRDTFRRDARQTVAEFLRSARGGRRLFVAAAPGDTLAVAVRRMLDAQVHRCWLVDASGAPAGTLTLADALRALLPAAPDAA